MANALRRVWGDVHRAVVTLYCGVCRRRRRVTFRPEAWTDRHPTRRGA